VPASRYLLGVHQLQDKKLAVASLIRSFQLTLLRNPLSHVPQARQQEQRWLCGVGINEDGPCVIGQTGGNSCVIAIRQANDEVGISSSPDTNERQTLSVQRVVRMGDGDPFLRWVVKGGSVL